MSYTIDTTTWRSPNFSERASAIESIVVHSCEGVWPSPRVSSLPWLCNPASRVSAHYYVCRNTEIFQLVDDDNEAWHAGAALPRWDNASSIGVECEHRAGQNWLPAQKDALAWLLRRLIGPYRIPLSAVETHGQIAIKGPYQRKLDPTDWPHNDFVRWRDALLTTIRVAGPHGAIARTDYRASAPTAAYFAPGTLVEIDTFDKNEYRHAASGIGFIASGDLL